MSKIFPQLYAKASTGRVKTWIIEADGDTMIIRNGLLGGAMKKQRKTIVGKNIGRANETTPEQQCELECQSKWQRKIDEQYTEDQNAATSEEYSEKEILLPMLAHSYEKRKHNIKFPCYVQPKLNGVRCIFQNGKFISRGGKEFTTLEHLRPELEILAENGITMPDGEIYCHGMNFQEIIRLVKKDRGDGSNAKLEYWIYDEISNKDFTKRLAHLDQGFADDDLPTSPKIQLVATELARSEEDIKKWHDEWVKQGFEGVIIRNADGKYAVKHRSKDLQKLKMFQDEEFEIISFGEGSGIEAGCITYTCITEEGKTFGVRPRGTHESRKELLVKAQNGDSPCGKKLTVRFQEKSESGVPVFPVGICVRDYE